MSDYTHILERRAELLAGKLRSKRQVLSNALKPPGQRPPFTKQMSQPEALAWWKLHRFDDLGKQVVNGMTPDSVLELDNALSAQNEAEIGGFGNGLY